ncbi:progonadoliberin-2 [Manis pentadactyla]|uniref:progonadoliberin-2 n=1 Tax=Manis pentadactyla TaxID=143292 RepID=UPI001873E0C1|nr:progonadoliberin-2 [Manis pentadactyla]
MASSRLGLLLLLTAHPGPSEAQHWSHDWYPRGKVVCSSSQHPQHALRPPDGKGPEPAQITHSLPSDALALPEDTVHWAGRTTGQWLLSRKQPLV